MQRGVAWLGALFVFTFVFAARAQSVGLPTYMHRQQPVRSDAQRPNWINRADCLARDVLTFSPVAVSGGDGDTLQVWAGIRGVNCTLVENRRTTGTPECWLVYTAPAKASIDVAIPAVDIVGRVATDGTDAFATVSHGVYPDACSTSTVSGGVPVGLSFFLVDSSGAIQGDPRIWTDIGYDTVPPSPPTNIDGSSSETRVHLGFTASPDLDVRSYRLYCDPPPGGAPPDAGLGRGTLGALSDVDDDPDASDAATAREAVDAGSGASGGCSRSTLLLPGTDPTSPVSLDRLRCGTAGSGDTGATIEGLTNGVDYVAAIAAVDEVGNVGKLSAQACETPVRVTDFFELYRAAGGQAGGGICSVSSLSRTSSATESGVVCAAAGFAIAGAIRRRGRRRSRAAS
jgi:hypothetical protein